LGAKVKKNADAGPSGSIPLQIGRKIPDYCAIIRAPGLPLRGESSQFIALHHKPSAMLLKWFFISLIIYLLYKMMFAPSALGQGEGERPSHITPEEPPRQSKPSQDQAGEYIDYEEVD
jgi:hypothetical protein